MQVRTTSEYQIRVDAKHVNGNSYRVRTLVTRIGSQSSVWRNERTVSVPGMDSTALESSSANVVAAAVERAQGTPSGPEQVEVFRCRTCRVETRHALVKGWAGGQVWKCLLCRRNITI